MTHRRLLVIGLLLIASCNNDVSPATTTTPAVETSTTTTTSTTIPTTTTTTEPATTSTSDPTVSFTWLNVDGIDFPSDPATVDDLPEVLTRYIDAPMPQPDLSITGPDDAQRWVAEWLDWMAWAGANPDSAAPQVDTGWLLTAPQGQQTQQGLEQLAQSESRRLGVPFYPTSITGAFDEFFDQGQILTLFIEVQDRVPTYTIDEVGTVTEVSPIGDETPVLELVLRYGEDAWKVEQINVQG